MAPKKRDCFNEINITPLTDIFLVLLIIMMVIAPMLDQQGLNLVVPDNVEMKEIKQEKKFLNIVVTNDNKFFLDSEEIPVEKLEDTIKEKSQEFADGLIIETEAEATHGAVVKLMDSARNVGVLNITISEI